ncbi:uncharacterized protein LOC144097006 [Amblyomma americanum]
MAAGTVSKNVEVCMMAQCRFHSKEPAHLQFRDANLWRRAHAQALTVAAVVLLGSLCAVHAGYPGLFPYGYGAAPALVVPKVVAPVYTPVVAKVPTAVSYSYFHSVHPPPLIKLHAAPALVKLPYAPLYH